MNPELPVTPRLEYAPLALGDARFLVELLNDADFRRFIGDRGVRVEGDVPGYLEAGPWASYQANGFGMLRLSERGTGRPVGIAGLIRRPALPDVDLGYALLPEFRGRGYAREACAALLAQARHRFALPRVIAIVDPSNLASRRTLEALGLIPEGRVRLVPDDVELELYATGANWRD